MNQDKFIRGDRFLLRDGTVVWFIEYVRGSESLLNDQVKKMSDLFKVTSVDRGLFQISRSDIKEVISGVHSRGETNAGVQEAGTDRNG